ncbi:hypothetical protein BGM26_17975 [Bacillus sp. FJAT-29790]|uniref:hypothetical protein n=1 Tax=Bacillus sp. FJAT-29790 TaxID=1895002 RepID=UPI001C23CDC6|nr:hypothetical protein [Bacillus sp. FJAT-29790]MBU8880844.1 hypothetical protein [Bacillus sp. FJAT-29790]
MLALVKDQRYNVLKSQFQHEYIESNMEQSLERICLFLYHHTNIYYLSFVNEKTLLDYLKYHRSISFEIIPFVRVVKDIKNFLFFLQNNKNEGRVPTIDLTVWNFDDWTRL